MLYDLLDVLKVSKCAKAGYDILTDMFFVINTLIKSQSCFEQKMLISDIKLRNHYEYEKVEILIEWSKIPAS